MRGILWMPITALALMAGCSSNAPTVSDVPVMAPVLAEHSVVPRAMAALAPASGSLTSGRLLIDATPEALRITGTVGGIAAGHTVAFHIHEHGDCSAADGSSAGPHFNPLLHSHGGPQTVPRHLGDLPNLTADRQGRVAVDVAATGVVLGGGAANDIVGRALVIHAQPDDHHSQPAGNAGTRIACGVIRVLP